MKPTGPQATFAARVARLHAELTREGIPLADMRRAQSLEQVIPGQGELIFRSPARQTGIEPLEGPIEARKIVRRTGETSGIRYFLDGTQRTLQVWRRGLIPIIATISAAAVLTRDERGACALLPGTLRLEHTWLIPEIDHDPDLRRIRQRLAAMGSRIVDPLASLLSDGDEGAAAAIAGDYGRLVELAYAAARDTRDQLERGLLQAWANDPVRAADDGWIVVDGRLRADVPKALGLVKQFSDSYLAGSDAETLLNLAPGARTTAFFPTDRYRGGPAPEARTLWYLRLWDATGLDARHALIRVETSSAVRTTAEIDRISAWLLTERTPRATADARWATLLYPVHYLERILKRRLEADTRGWPGG